MSDDIIARAEAALEGRWPGARIASPTRFFGSLVRELVAELKTTRAQLAQVNRAFLDNCRICAVGDQDCPFHGESPYQPRRATEAVRNV
ncbi:hypothetical protein PJP13_24300 [Mycobacterium kansasii]